MPGELRLLISVANAIFPVYYNILSHCYWRLHSARFPTQWTGNRSMASDFLRLISRGWEGPAHSQPFVLGVPKGPSRPPWTLPPRPQSGGGLSPLPRRSPQPWETLLISAKVMSFLFTYDVYCF